MTRVIIVARLVRRSEMSPLETVHWAQVAFASMTQTYPIEIFSTAIAFPYIYTFRREEFTVRSTRDEPQQLFDDPTGEDAFGGQKRERRIGETETECGRSKDRIGARSSPVGAMLTCGDDSTDQIEILVFLWAAKSAPEQDEVNSP